MDAGNSSPGSIRFLTGPLAGNTYQITKAVITIGREPGNDIVISDPSVSRQHAQIAWNNGVWSIRKLSPQNMLTVNQRETQQATINDRDTIGLGAGTTFLFQVAARVRPISQPAAAPQNASITSHMAPPGPAQVVAPQPPVRLSPQQAAFGPPPPPYIPTEPAPSGVPQNIMQDTMRASTGRMQSGYGVGVPTLEVSTNVDNERQPYPLTKPVINIGRDPSNDIVINRPTVSGFHAQIVRDGNQLVFVHPHPDRGKTLNGITYQGRTIAGTYHR